MTRPALPHPAPATPPNQKPEPNGRFSLRRFAVITLLVYVLLIAVTHAFPVKTTPKMPLNTFTNQLDAGQVVYVKMHNTVEHIDVYICGGEFDLDDPEREDCTQPEQDYEDPGSYEPVGTRWQVTYPYRLQSQLAENLLERDVTFDVVATQSPGFFSSVIRLAVPLLIIVGALVLLMPGMMRGGVTKFKGGQDKVREVPSTRFVDVAGADEVVSELSEIVDFLDNPGKYQAVGASPPKGVLLVGPPGTGKTLLARAVAGEANVAFFALAGSDFVEVFAGAGASRVRQIFAAARKAKRAIIFIDEIDAVGKRRSSNGPSSGGHDEREQTLNQLLVELDGFSTNDQIFVLAATNRADTLDPALLRSGRFDRRIEVPLPDRAGREQILQIHAKKHPVERNVNLDAIAAQCPGFSGADIANLCNQAALSAARDGSPVLSQRHFQDALYTIALGRERRSRIITDEERRIVAYHEAGHTTAAFVLEHVPNPARVTIVPRGHTGGQTWIPDRDTALVSQRAAKEQLIVSLAGRAAEMLMFGPEDVTQGAAGDFQSSTRLAKAMVSEYGMTSFGIAFLEPEDYRFNNLADEVHRATAALLNEAQEQALMLLETHRALLDAVAAELLVSETLDLSDIERIAANLTAAGEVNEDDFSDSHRHPSSDVSSDADDVTVDDNSSSRTGGKGTGHPGSLVRATRRRRPLVADDDPGHRLR